jgi:glyoxylase-like metal-dependent hydrolase (beta-lactamase superfamily II)
VQGTGTTEGEIVKIAPHLHRIGSDIVPSYLVEDGTDVTIVDAGIAGLWRELPGELEAMGRSMAEVRAVILTHGDTDHIGYAERIRREHGVPVHIHADDAARATGAKGLPNGKAGPKKVGPTLGFLWYAARHGGLRTTHLKEVRTFTGGEVLDVPGSPRVVHLPGHTEGSVAFHFPAIDAVFAGDALTTRNVLTGVRGPQPAPFTLDPAMALASLDAVAELDATWLLPGHGPAWDGGVREAIRRVREAGDRPGT